MTLIDLANPTRFLSLTARVLPWLVAATAILLIIGLYQSATAPDDYQQGATVKIMFIHVPNAWLSMFVWGVMSLAALGTLVWRHPLADVAAKAAASSSMQGNPVPLETGELRAIYDRMLERPLPPTYRPAHGGAPGIVRAHSLDPQLIPLVFGTSTTLNGAGPLAWPERELVNAITSRLNQCLY